MIGEYGLWAIICGDCAETSPFEEWTVGPDGKDLPPDTFTCPRCGVSLRRKQGTATIYSSGFVMPGIVTIERIEDPV